MKDLILMRNPNDGEKWILAADFEIETSKGLIVVPKGFGTDLASTPRILWPIFPPFGDYTEASVVHDYLCRTQQFTRKEGDIIFKEIMLKYNTKKWKANTMYSAVRMYAIFRLGTTIKLNIHNIDIDILITPIKRPGVIRK